MLINKKLWVPGWGAPNGLKFAPAQTMNYGRQAMGGGAPHGLKFARTQIIKYRGRA